MRRRLWLVLAALPLAGGDRFETIRGLIRKQLDETRTPSLAVAVAKGGKIIWEEGFGWADREKRLAASEHTMYSLASISKPVTATGLMVLVEAGKIELDRPVNDYLGDAKLRARIGDAAQATVRRVANHTSGLPLHYHFFYADEPYRRPPMDETIRRYGSLVSIPGEKYQYSNLGYGVLDYVIARVAGRSYRDFMREEVFTRLELRHMSVHLAPGLEAHSARRYASDGQPLPHYDFDHEGGSAVYSSAHDLVRFAMFHLKTREPDQQTILTDPSIDEMQKPTAKINDYSGYGVGWNITETPGGYRLVSHSGGMGGVSTTLRLAPAEKLAVVVLANSGGSLPHRIADQILALLLPKWKNPPSQPGPKGFNPPRELVGEWRGAIHTYKTELPLELRISESGDVRARLDGQPESAVSGIAWRDGTLTGRMGGDVRTEDANRTSYAIALDLKLRGSLLNGAATAQSRPASRPGNALTNWVELKKQ